MTMKNTSGSNVIRALDFAVAFATLETYGVVDGRDERARTLRPPIEGSRSTTRASGRSNERCRRTRYRHAGRPPAATAAGLRHHRIAVRRLERLRYSNPREDRTAAHTAPAQERVNELA